MSSVIRNHLNYAAVFAYCKQTDMKLRFTSKNPKWAYAIVATLFLIFILNFLEPFSIYNPTANVRFAALLSGYGFIGGLILLVNEFKAIPFLRKSFSSLFTHFWAVHSWHLLTLSFGVWGYNHFLHYFFPEYHFPAFSYVESLQKTILIGIMPISIAAMIPFLLYQFKTVPTANTLLYLQSQQGKDWLRIALDQLLFIASSDNYVTIYYLENKKVQRKLLRSSLKAMETQLDSFPVRRCHHSYIVNLLAISYLEGNARNLRLNLLHWEHPIPVSRKYATTISEALKDLNMSAEVAV